LETALFSVNEIGLLKTDVQGFEMEVFRGAEIISTQVKAILIEIN
jgi:FkbM family methyltransferase